MIDAVTGVFEAVLLRPVAAVLDFWHRVLGAVVGDEVSWVGGIILLTVTVRVLLFPLFVKQIRSQRAIQQLGPEIKKVRDKYKHDREVQSRELMKLYKEHGANPLSGCWPLLLQLPIFFALFSVLRRFQPSSDDGGFVYSDVLSIPAEQVEEAAGAKFFGAPIATAATSAQALFDALEANPTTVRVVVTVLVVLMGVTTYLSQRQMISRNPATDPTQQTVQKFLLYVLPFSFAIFGFSFPLGVLLYWTTTNIWSLAQQQYVLRKYPPGYVPPKRGEKKRAAQAAADRDADPADAADETTDTGRSGVTGTVTDDAPGARRPPVRRDPQPVARPNRAGAQRARGSRSQRKRKGGRR